MAPEPAGLLPSKPMQCSQVLLRVSSAICLCMLRMVVILRICLFLLAYWLATLVCTLVICSA